MPAHHGVWLENDQSVTNGGNQAVEAEEDQPIGVGQVQALGRAPGKHDELLAQHRILGLETLARCE